MPLFRYQAIAASGEMVSGEMEGMTQEIVIDALHRLGHVPLRADPAGGRLSWGTALRLPLTRPKRLNLALLTQQLGILLQAGLPLDRALEIALRILTGEAERTALRNILDRVRGGSSLADAMADQPALFPAFYVGMVRAGETGGSLDATLRHLSEYLEQVRSAREQVKSALVYPVLVLATGMASITVLFGFVIPSFRPLLEESGKAPPASAQIVLAISDIVRDGWWIMLLAVIAVVVIVRRQLRVPAFRRYRDQRLLALPVAGDLVVKTEMGRFCRTLGTLLKNGVAPLTALSITHGALTNLALRGALDGVVDRVKEGKGLAEPLAQAKAVPPLVVDLVRVGEETARLDDMLLKIAEIYDEETRRATGRLLAMLVPAVTIGLGIIVALVVGSILTAILSVYDLAM
ncbi:MAG TPA: type II secretion system F family protein [Stellaceae bacterium]|jgi:general secretion pathway protein F|nr:type II secretion system F family protein [Stellaceae bacterium]